MNNIDTGDKVVCINGRFDQHIAKLYDHLPAEGQTYVVRDVRLGIRLIPKREADVSLLLVGLINPKGPPPASLERGFSSDRFRKLEEMQAQGARKQVDVEKAPQLVPYYDTEEANP